MQPSQNSFGNYAFGLRSVPDMNRNVSFDNLGGVAAVTGTAVATASAMAVPPTPPAAAHASTGMGGGVGVGGIVGGGVMGGSSMAGGRGVRVQQGRRYMMWMRTWFAVL